MNYYEHDRGNKTTVNGGVGATGLLGVAFVVLKLMGVINWSWWWVTCPFWGGFALIILILIILFVVETIKEVRRDRRRRK